MKNRKFYVVLAAILMLACGYAKAQTDTFLNLGVSLPSGNFAEGDESKFALLDESKEGGAGIGFNLGFKFKFPTNADGLGVLLTIDGIYNGLNKDIKDYFEDYRDGLEDYGDVTLRKPCYINVPVMLGLNYCYDISDSFGIYGEAGLGADARFITNYKTEVEDRNFEISQKTTYDPAVAFAFQLGAGVLINDRFTIGLNFYNLGSAKVKGKYTLKEKEGSYSESEKENFKLKSLSTSMILLRLGIRL